MFSEKLVALLQTFPRPALNRFRKYLQSPYLNEQPLVARLFDIADAALRKGPAALEALDKDSVWRRLCPELPYDDQQLRRLASDLTQLALEFMLAEARQQEPLGDLLELQRLLGKPELKKHLGGVERQIDRLLEETGSKSSAYYHAQFRKHLHVFNQASRTVSTTGYMDKLRSADHYLECFYSVQKLKFYVGWLQYRDFRATTEVLELAPGFWEHLQGPQFAEVPIIGIYLKIITCLKEPGEEAHFRALVADLEEFAAVLPREDLREFNQIAQNYCALKINQGRTEYYAVFFALIQSAMQQGILLENGQLSEGVFKNTVTIALRENAFEWAEAFIRDYAPFLPSNIRENARTFNLANLYSHQKQHQRVIELLRDVEYSDVVYTLGAKLILLRTYYESGELLAMDSLIDSFRIYLRRNQVMSKGLKREYNNFLNFLKKLSSVSPSDRAALQKLRQKIQAAQPLTSKKWLLEKAEALSRSW